MSTETTNPRIYHVAPWRYLWIWFVFGPLGLVFLGLGIFLPSSSERAGMVVGGAMFLAVTLFIHLLVRWARLEISERGVRLRQSGYRLEAPWADIIGMRLDRGHESFITSRPVGGKGAALLAAAGRATGSVFIGMGFYDAEQQALLNEHRLIPIEAFAWYLRHGQLRADLERLAPHLCTVLAHLDAPLSAHPVSTPRPPIPQPARPKATVGQWATFILIVLSILALVAFASTSKAHNQIGHKIVAVLIPTSFALSIGVGSRNCFRIGSWLAGTGLALVAILVGLWAFAEASGLADMFGAGRVFIQVCVLLLFAFLAFAAAAGTRRAFRRGSWLLGVVLLLVAGFLTLFVVFAAFDLAKPHSLR